MILGCGGPSRDGLNLLKASFSKDYYILVVGRNYMGYAERIIIEHFPERDALLSSVQVIHEGGEKETKNASYS